MTATGGIEAADDANDDEGAKETRGGPGTRSATTYPYYDLEEAEKFAKGIASVGGAEAADEDVMRAIGLASMQTRAWSYRVSTAKEFGLVARGARNDGRLLLTDLGRRVVSPGSAPEYRAALLNAFLTPKLYKKLFDQYKGVEIPRSEYIQNTLKSKHGLLDTVLETAATAFIKSAKYAGAVGADSRLTADLAAAAPRPPSDTVPDRQAISTADQQIEVPDTFIPHRFQLRRDLTITVPLPADLSQADVRRLHRWLTTLPLEDEPAANADNSK